VINQHQAVRMSRVSGRSSPITGALVVAEVVTNLSDTAPFDMIKQEILALCRDQLPAHAVPVTLRRVPMLAIAESGKLERPFA
jgi:acyl-coenzyme A synthetase/AMP-(fatty) acid ligase